MDKYYKKDCVVFWKTKEQWGGLSNMASGYPIFVNECTIRTSEALYQALKFSNYPEIQKEIIEQRSPLWAKKVAYKYRNKFPANWNQMRFDVMWWVLQAKLVCNWATFRSLLDETKDKMIVEKSTRDTFWGAIDKGSYLEGYNILGQQLVVLRETFIQPKKPETLHGFKLFGEEILNLTPKS